MLETEQFLNEPVLRFHDIGIGILRKVCAVRGAWLARLSVTNSVRQNQEVLG